MIKPNEEIVPTLHKFLQEREHFYNSLMQWTKPKTILAKTPSEKLRISHERSWKLFKRMLSNIVQQDMNTQHEQTESVESSAS